jgi:hypothetical protein
MEIAANVAIERSAASVLSFAKDHRLPCGAPAPDTRENEARITAGNGCNAGLAHLGGPAARPSCHPNERRRPVALRPRLSPRLPFSVTVCSCGKLGGFHGIIGGAMIFCRGGLRATVPLPIHTW